MMEIPLEKKAGRLFGPPGKLKPFQTESSDCEQTISIFTMQGFVVAVLALTTPFVDAAMLRAGQEPDTACGKGFDNLVKGSQEYYKTAAEKLWSHPYHLTDKDTFGKEFECWFGLMATTKCDGLPSQADARKDELTKKCLAHDTEWMPIWKMFSEAEVTWFKKTYPSLPTEGDVKTVNMGQDRSEVVNYKEAMETAKEVNKKELLCLTLFTIDDECVKYPHIRMGK